MTSVVPSGTIESNLTVASQTTLTVFGTIINTTADLLAGRVPPRGVGAVGK
jgi:hypothetical protein